MPAPVNTNSRLDLFINSLSNSTSFSLTGRCLGTKLKGSLLNCLPTSVPSCLRTAAQGFNILNTITIIYKSLYAYCLTKEIIGFHLNLPKSITYSKRPHFVDVTLGLSNLSTFELFHDRRWTTSKLVTCSFITVTERALSLIVSVVFESQSFSF